ncbi:MAG: cadherin-like domain-containing protein [Clostridia bacterium]|nr:cadherin-like domain-containing protein [Clostridia bacterium]
MKRKTGVILTVLSILLSLLPCTAISYAGESFGSGMAVLASQVGMVKTGLLGQKLGFSDADFKSALCITDFDTITVTKIPSSTEGALLLSGRRVGEGKVIKEKNIGALVFVPASPEVTESRFRFTVEGYGSGEEIECVMKFIDKVNYAPIAEGDEAVSLQRTQMGISVYGKMYGEDPEGDSLTYMVIAYPKYGYLSAYDKDTGKYCYTPIGSYTGKDKFTYVVRDEYGNYSYPATVSLTVNSRMCDTVYADMTDRSEYNAAVAMTAMGVMNGRVLGDSSYFMPDREISRAEFVAIAMKSMGIRADSTLTHTCFDDDKDIEPGLKSYIATAQRIGLVNGDFKDGSLLFSPNESITKYEAAKIMATIIGATDEGEDVIYSGDEIIPVWARSGVSAMRTLRVFDDEDSESTNEAVTRADTASYLYRLISALESSN